MSSGIFIQRSTSRANTQQGTVSSTAQAALSITATAMLLRMPASSFAPQRCPRQMPEPPVKPLTKQNTKYMMLPVAPTAASAPTSSVLPTMIESASV